MYIRYRINNELVDLYPPSDEEDFISHLTDDNTKTIEYIRVLAATGQIRVTMPINIVTRFISETEEEFVYDGRAQESEPVGEVTSELDIGNSENGENYDPNQGCGPSQSKQSHAWDDNHTRFVLDKFHDYLRHIGPMKKFKTKKVMWEQISADLNNETGLHKSAVQIENRYKTVIRRKKDAIVNNSKSGRSRTTVPFEEELTKIARLDDSIEPEVILSPRHVNINNKRAVTESDSDEEEETTQNKKITAGRTEKTKRKKTSSIVNTLKRLHAEKEYAKQERHREKIELIRELFGNEN